jgi:hypothetical protein
MEPRGLICVIKITPWCAVSHKIDTYEFVDKLRFYPSVSAWLAERRASVTMPGFAIRFIIAALLPRQSMS